MNRRGGGSAPVRPVMPLCGWKPSGPYGSGDEKGVKVKQRSSFAQLVGTSIKQYGLIQVLQQEQHEAVFLARHTGAEQICQLRLFALSEEIPAQERLILLERVQQEMGHIAALQHPVIQPILEY